MSVEREILALEEEVFAAIREKDTAALGRILTEDFVLRMPNSEEVGRGAFLAGVQAIPVEILAVWSDDMKVKVYGETAVLTGVQRARTRGAEGNEEQSAQAFVDVFVRQEGKWRMALAYSVELPAEEASAG